MNTHLPIAVWSGEFRLFGGVIKCHVLDDGRRIIEADSLADLFNPHGPTERSPEVEAEIEQFLRWLHGPGGPGPEATP